MFSFAIERALRAAHAAHQGQTRKGGDVPYVVHPLHAAVMLARLGGSETAIQAALLHDVVEDCEEWTVERVADEFGVEVAGIVAELTEDKSLTWEARKRAAVEHVAHLSPDALLVKAVDKLHNLETLVSDLSVADDPGAVWDSFSRGPEETLAMSRALVDALAPRVTPRLRKALLDAVKALGESVGGDSRG